MSSEHDRHLPSSAMLTEAVVRELRDRLPVLLAEGEAGQKVVIHIAPGRKSVKIEWPALITELRV